MPFDLSDTTFTGPALPEPFVKFELENELTKLKLLPKTTGNEGKQLKADWDAYRRHLAQLAVRGGPLRVRNQAIEPLRERLGYTGEIESADDVETREGREDGGCLLTAPDGAKLRIWTTDLDEDLDAPAKRGQAYRYSHLRIAQRVLLAKGERVGLLTNGVELRLLISDPARPESQVIFSLDPTWKRSRDVPDSFRLLLALIAPAGVKAIPGLVDKARLQQARVTKDLRDQARQAIARFVQEVLDQPDNRPWLEKGTRGLFTNNVAQASSLCLGDTGKMPVLPPPSVNNAGTGPRRSGVPVPFSDRQSLARALWHEGLIIVYRLLFILKLESSSDPARLFTFASTSLWRNTFSPAMALARYAPKVLYDGAETGGLLEHGLRGLFRMFHEGVECTELNVKPLGGSLFGAGATPVLSQLRWGERAVAHLLDQLLWTTPKKKSGARERVHYGSLDVEDLGRVYEALLELEPGIATEPMCRLRRQKLEVVVPIAQGEKYRPEQDNDQGPITKDQDEVEDEEDGPDEEDEAPKRGKKTTVQWIEKIDPGEFFLRVGLGRKATGSYYTPHSFVRFLVQETLGPQVAERSPPDDPQPCEILKLKVLDPACGSGHFLVESCRFLGQHLYEAARLCDEKATAAERRAEAANRRAPVSGTLRVPLVSGTLRVPLSSGGTRSVPDTIPAAKDKGTGPQRSGVPVPFSDKEYESALAEAQKYRQRLIDLPDPDGELLRYLPSRVTEGEQAGLSQRRAEALCRRLVAVHCLYGVDKNPLAVELAKLALWLEAHAEGMPLTFLDHRIVAGDSLTGPFWNNLITRPSDPKEPIEGLFHQGLSAALAKTLHDAIRYVGDLEATAGISQAETENKIATKIEMDRALRAFRIIAAAWSGGVMLGPKKCDDFGYAELLKSVAATGDLPPTLPSPFGRGVGSDGAPGGRGEEPDCRLSLRESSAGDPGERGQLASSTATAADGDGSSDDDQRDAGLLAMIARGLGITLPLPPGEGRGEGLPDGRVAGVEGVWTRDQLYAQLDSGGCVPALPFDLTFPEVFYPTGVPYQRHGFDTVLGNPPWDTIRRNDDQFFGTIDFSYLAPPTKKEKARIKEGLLNDTNVGGWYGQYVEDLQSQDRICDCLFEVHKARVKDQLAGRGTYDAYMLFAERSATLLRKSGTVGIVLPSAFHANEGATGIRRLYLEKMALRCCYSFENRRKLFEIDSRFKFALVVAAAGSVTDHFSCAFYLHDDERLFRERGDYQPLQYTLDFVRRTGGDYLSLLELRSAASFDVAKACYMNGKAFGDARQNVGLRMSQEVNMTYDADRFTASAGLLPAGADPREPIAGSATLNEGFLVLHEGKTFHQFDDRWGEAPRYLIGLTEIADKRSWITASRFYRLAFRDIAGSTNERTCLFAMMPPGVLFGHTAVAEREPAQRASAIALLWEALANSYCFDWQVRQKNASHVSLFILDSCVLPTVHRGMLLTHTALRLTCNHLGYAPLWREQVANAWRENGKPPMTWPVLAGDDERWAVRAAIDAVVAEAYGLSREQYAHVLSTFSHASYRKAPELCLARFDELKQLGLEAFTRKHDPYWDIPLNESLPQPVIDLPIPGEAKEGENDGFRLARAGTPPRRGRKKK